MKVVVVEPGYQPYEKEIDGLAEMQAVVGGLITAAYPFVSTRMSRSLPMMKEYCSVCRLTAASPEATAAFSARSLSAASSRANFALLHQSRSKGLKTSISPRRYCSLR